MVFAGGNLGLTLVATVLCVCFAPTAAGPGIPEIKAYLNGIDTPNMFGATTMIVKVCFLNFFKGDSCVKFDYLTHGMIDHWKHWSGCSWT